MPSDRDSWGWLRMLSATARTAQSACLPLLAALSQFTKGQGVMPWSLFCFLEFGYRVLPVGQPVSFARPEEVSKVLLVDRCQAKVLMLLGDLVGLNSIARGSRQGQRDKVLTIACFVTFALVASQNWLTFKCLFKLSLQYPSNLTAPSCVPRYRPLGCSETPARRHSGALYLGHTRELPPVPSPSPRSRTPAVDWFVT